jgi:hypothetical protein
MKLHFLRAGLYGFYENFMTYCGVAGNYSHDVKIRHYRTGVLYNYTNDRKRVTCKTCLKMMEREKCGSK